MGQLVAIALGGAIGAVFRFWVAGAVYQWLGRGFPYGTLAVNLLGSLLIGMVAEVLILQRIVLATEFRVAVMVGLLGAFTTFSTFSLETLYLLEQGQWLKSLLNIVISVSGCLVATLLGLVMGRVLFITGGGMVHWLGWSIPHAVLIINTLIAFLLGMVAAFLAHKTAVAMEYRAAVVILLAGIFTTISSLYVVLYLMEHGHTLDDHLHRIVALFGVNVLLCIAALWSGLWVGYLIGD